MITVKDVYRNMGKGCPILGDSKAICFMHKKDCFILSRNKVWKFVGTEWELNEDDVNPKEVANLTDRPANSFVGMMNSVYDLALHAMVKDENDANIRVFFENLEKNRSKGILDVVPLGLKDSAELVAGSILTNDLNLGICLADTEHNPEEKRNLKMLALSCLKPKQEPDKEDIANICFMLIAMGFFEEVLKNPDDYIEKLTPVILKTQKSIASLVEKAEMSVIMKDDNWSNIKK